ncbi:serine hydrolase domain-containing protein [Xanthocytophaga flava]|uniref:serine hydrolase domain-containing protein n=1 Tax=Xanthocytophaga flava TaxID=3048013 RepID=UPI0028D19401|nr:serine hydrolase domain-containing protein [Xanthocytophaga flavus]MDJ1470188.1 serine hydrolase domain-containing protein [Xanthocytophaga flavus]
MKKQSLLLLLNLFTVLSFIQTDTFAQKGRLNIEAVDRLFSKYDTLQSSSVSIMIVENGKICYNRSFGLAEIETGRKATASTNYRIASVTKPFTAMAILMLRDAGKLNLEDPLTKFFPSIPAFGKQVTIQQMLNHTSGLAGYGDFIAESTIEPLQDEDVLHMVEKQDSTRFQPGSEFSYSNTAYVLLGLIVEKVSGKSFADFMKEHIFKPLQMDNSTLNSRTGVIANRAYGYNLIEGTLLRQDQSLYSYLLGDGGIYSSLTDFYKWDQALYSNKLVKKSTLKEMFMVSSHETPDIGYGYGWYTEKRFGQERISHSGGTTGFSSYYVRYPSKKFSIILFANQDDGFAAEPFVNAIEQMYFGQ